MLNVWKTSAAFAFCAILTFAVAQAQTSTYQQTASPSAYGQSQYDQPQANTAGGGTGQTHRAQVQLTPQQLAAMQQAATEQSTQQPTQQSAALQNALNKSIPLPRRPFPELQPSEVEYLHKFLDFWEHSSQQVERYTCNFQRFDYDTEIVNYRDPQTQQLAACSVAYGNIRYAQPDRGRYETTDVLTFTEPPKTPGGQAKYDKLDNDIKKERWICDGENIYTFDFSNKKLYEEEIPVEMRGEEIVNSPLPFLFGAKKAQVLERYWVRVIPQPKNQQNQNEYWLEAYPKRIEDARLYSKVEIIIAAEDFLPKAIHLYSPQYDPQKNNYSSRYFAFTNRKKNSQLTKVQDFFGWFVRPTTPLGWQRTQMSNRLQQPQQAALPDGIAPRK